MGFLFFGRKKEEPSSEIKESFNTVKQDIHHISGWIKHLNEKNKHHDERFEHLMEEIMKIKEDIDGIKNQVFMFKHSSNPPIFKHQQTSTPKQTPVQSVQTGVQTGVQTPFFDEIVSGLSQTERLIVWILLNSEVRLSCEDIATLLGKQKNTVRGQINSIKQKCGNVISESLEGSKKRYYLADEVRENMIKNLKNRSKRVKSSSK
jgi:hypothetical protein